jgi:hypothetical protein
MQALAETWFWYHFFFVIYIYLIAFNYKLFYNIFLIVCFLFTISSVLRMEAVYFSENSVEFCTA